MEALLTRRQERLLRFIERFRRTFGSSPTLREMADSLEVNNTHGIVRHLTALQKKGYIRRQLGRRRFIEILRPLDPLSDAVPILGRVAAGHPLLAVENLEGALTLGPALLGSGVHFALRVQGDSMIEAGIQEGDFVVVRQQDEADPGAIVVALIDDEATVKRLRKHRERYFLEPANPAYAPIPFSASTKILGLVVGLYRGFGQTQR